MGQLRKRGLIWWSRYSRVGRRFETRALAVQWAEAERKDLEKGDCGERGPEVYESADGDGEGNCCTAVGTLLWRTCNGYDPHSVQASALISLTAIRSW